MRSYSTISSNSGKFKLMSSSGASALSQWLMISATSSGRRFHPCCGRSSITISSGINGPMAIQACHLHRQEGWRYAIKTGSIWIWMLYFPCQIHGSILFLLHGVSGNWKTLVYCFAFPLLFFLCSMLKNQTQNHFEGENMSA